MIGNKVGSSLMRVYTTGNTSLVENSKHTCKNIMDANMARFFAREVLQSSKFLGQPQTLIQETWPQENSNFRHFLELFFHLVCHTNHCLE